MAFDVIQGDVTFCSLIVLPWIQAFFPEGSEVQQGARSTVWASSGPHRIRYFQPRQSSVHGALPSNLIVAPHLVRKKSGDARGGGTTGERIREMANRREVHGVRCIEAGETTDAFSSCRKKKTN